MLDIMTQPEIITGTAQKLESILSESRTHCAISRYQKNASTADIITTLCAEQNNVKEPDFGFILDDDGW